MTKNLHSIEHKTKSAGQSEFGKGMMVLVIAIDAPMNFESACLLPDTSMR
jgi:hypothetical protein